MIKGRLPNSEFEGDKIKLPTPGGHFVYYPTMLARLGINGVYTVFATICSETGVAYLCFTQPDCVRIRAVSSDIEKISELYENAPGEEDMIFDNNGVFFYKKAPSLKVSNAYGDSLMKDGE